MMTPGQRIQNAKEDAEAHVKTLPESFTVDEISTEFFKYYGLRLETHIMDMGGHLINLTD